MILVDTSVWVDHLRRTDADLVTLLDDTQVWTHPMVVGELALGSLQNRATVLALLDDLPEAPAATHREVRHFVERHALHGAGLSLVDVHLLASVRLAQTSWLWTRDRTLREAAERLGVRAGFV